MEPLDPPPTASAPARAIFAFGAGKGGVGKSTVTLNVAFALRDLGYQVGVIDADIFGPNIPRMLNLARKDSVKYWDLAYAPGTVSIPPLDHLGIQVISSGFVLGEDDSLRLGGPYLDMVVRQFLFDVAWRNLDIMLIDLPPGTTDIHASVIRQAPLTGVVVVVTPDDVAHLDGRRAIDMFAALGARVVGGVENMGPLICTTCGTPLDLHPPAQKQRTIWQRGVRRLGRIPFDLDVARGAQEGVPVVVRSPQSPATRAFREIAESLRPR